MTDSALRFFLASALLAAASLGNAWPAAADPRVDYMLNCRGCHGPDGAGLPGAAPSFRQLPRLLSVDAGREYLVRVPGTAQSELSDARVAALLNWIVAELGGMQAKDGFLPYTEREVARYRTPPLNDVAAARRDLVVAIEERERCGSD